MGKSNGLTPLMVQHNNIKQKYPDAILLFRVGDFYETFGDDAIVTSKILNITLTKRNNGIASSSELAGFPHHALDTYLHKLVKAGYRVAICDQLENPKNVKGIVKRGVTELVTPGIATNEKLLNNQENNYLAAIYCINNEGGIAFLDISTGDFFVVEGNIDYLFSLIHKFKPAEIIFAKNFSTIIHEKLNKSYFTYSLDNWIFDLNYCVEILLKQFKTHSLKGFGIDNFNDSLIAAGAILHYLKETEHPHLQHINKIHPFYKEEYVWLDSFTIKNLELVETNSNKNCLLDILNQCQTPMGARLLRKWMLFPLINQGHIENRLNAVQYFIENNNIHQSILAVLKNMGDIERLVSKLPNNKIQPRELMQLKQSLQDISIIKSILDKCNNHFLQQLLLLLNPLEEIVQSIQKTIITDPPPTKQKGGYINNQVSDELDELRTISKGGKDFLTTITQKEIINTGISSLKISYNNVFGYYLEVTNLHKDKVPTNWIRKQTLTNAERYITLELKEYEEKILHADEKTLQLEEQIYTQLINELIKYIPIFQSNALQISILDCLTNFGEIATQYNYVKPVVTNQPELKIEGGRHPVIERSLPLGENYISNDIFLNQTDQQIIILTGPNMSGKSALLRQTAIITLMAHIGSFVPATNATIPITDKIFTRLGANDNLNEGESTFMVEMNESASILNNLTERSLIILDEIGRGTATFDGIAIAWSIVEYLQKSVQKPKTLFATHYHELNEIEQQLERVKNYHISYKELNNKIIFLRKLCKGGSVHSFGIHVAKMAGMPIELVLRAEKIMQLLEEKGSQENTSSNTQKLQKITTEPYQLTIFDEQTAVFSKIRNMLDSMDVNRLTPVEALFKLNEIKNMFYNLN